MNTTTPVQIRIDKEIREKANALFKELGTDMSGAVNMFLRQCVYTDSIPLELKRPRGNRGDFEGELGEGAGATQGESGAQAGGVQGGGIVQGDKEQGEIVDPLAKRYASFGEYQEIMRKLEQGE